MSQDKHWPNIGDRLVHHFRKKSGSIEATVTNVDRTNGTIEVSVNGETFRTLSAAALSVSGHPTNGWVYWGLKKQKRYPGNRVGG